MTRGLTLVALLAGAGGAGCGRVGFEPGGDEPCGEVPAGCDGFVFECAETASCYLKCSADLGWQPAVDACRAWGGDLVTIETLEENACLAVKIPIDTVWIGLHQLPGQGAYVWSSGSSASYRNWQPGEPDDVGYLGETVGVDCTRLNNDGGNRWLDEPCDHGYDYMCER